MKYYIKFFLNHSININYSIYWSTWMPQSLTMRVTLHHVNPSTCHVPRLWTSSKDSLLKNRHVLRDNRNSHRPNFNKRKQGIGPPIFPLSPPRIILAPKFFWALSIKIFYSFGTTLFCYSSFLWNMWEDVSCGGIFRMFGARPNFKLELPTVYKKLSGELIFPITWKPW